MRSRSSRDCVELSTRPLWQVNTEMAAIIERLQATLRKEQEEAAAAAGSDSGALSGGDFASGTRPGSTRSACTDATWAEITRHSVPLCCSDCPVFVEPPAGNGEPLPLPRTAACQFSSLDLMSHSV